MNRFDIKLARIEKLRGTRTDPQVRVTFRIERGALGFYVPIDLSMGDYDDTEMVQAARNILHRTLAELTARTRHWKLSPKDVGQLSRMSRRPAGHRSSRRRNK